MSIPGNAFTAVPDIAQFISPYSDTFDPLKMRCIGGIAVGDVSQGRDVRNWVVEYLDPNIVVYPENQAVVFTLPIVGVETVSLAFDNNMAIVLAWQIGTTSTIYYFDAVAAAYITKSVSNTTSCRICLDDERSFSNADSDIIFMYTRNDGTLLWRQQRDRYDVDYTVGTTTRRIFRLGPNAKRRLQVELR